MQSLVTVFSTLLLGTMIFFAAVLTPAVFRFLDADAAAEFMRKLFPRYFLCCAVLSLPILFFAGLDRSTLTIPATIIFAGFIYNRQFLMAKIIAAKEQWQTSESPQDKAVYKSLHRRSVIINSTQILLLFAIIVANQFLDPQI